MIALCKRDRKGLPATREPANYGHSVPVSQGNRPHSRLAPYLENNRHAECAAYRETRSPKIRSSMKSTRYILIAAFLCGSAALGQPAGASGAVNGVQNTVRGLPPPPPLPNGGDNSAGTRLSGRVAVDDGSVAPRGIAIEIACTNLTRTVASTDSKGRFTFQYGGAANVSDASDSGQRSSSPLLAISSGDGVTALRTVLSCDLRANLAGYRSDEVSLSDRHALDHSDVGVIVLHRLFTVEGVAVSRTSLNAPKEARTAYESGLKAMRSGRMDGAAKEFEQAIAAYPAYANAWLDLGRARQQRLGTQTAREAWKEAIELDPKLMRAYVELGLDAGLSHDWKAGHAISRSGAPAGPGVLPRRMVRRCGGALLPG